MGEETPQSHCITKLVSIMYIHCTFPGIIISIFDSSQASTFPHIMAEERLTIIEQNIKTYLYT